MHCVGWWTGLGGQKKNPTICFHMKTYFKISIYVAKNTISRAAAQAGILPTWCWLSVAAWVWEVQKLLGRHELRA